MKTYNFSKKHWMIIMIGFVLFLMSSAMTSDGENIILPKLATQNDWDYSRVLMIATAAGCSSVVGNIILGRTCEKRGPKLTICFSLFVGAACLILYGTAHSMIVYGIGLFGTICSGQAISFLGANALIANWFPKKKGLAMSVISVGPPIATVLMAVIFNSLVNQKGIRFGVILMASMPGVTGEMMDWWGLWHSLDPIRYQIWAPEDHVNVEVDAIGRQRALDSSIPNKEKLWGATHVDIESMGGTPDKVTMHFANPADMGFDASLIGTEKCSAFLCGNAGMGDMMVIPVFMAESFVERDGGLEVRARFWIGYNIIDGEPQFLLPPGMPVPGDVCVGLIQHNIREFTHLAKVLPDLYAEYKDKWIVR